MDELIQAMSIAELETFKTQYHDNESITKIIDGYIEVKVRQVAQEKAKADFAKAIGKLADKLPHPDDIHNVYMAWREVDEPVPGSEPEEVEIDIGDGSKSIETRQPMQKVAKWVVELNKGFQVGRTTSGTPTASKRAITLHKRNGTQLELIGNFPSASKACEYLKITIAGDSATRVLAREGYILDAYTGTDFQS